jgi:hypothetical protein
MWVVTPYLTVRVFGESFFSKNNAPWIESNVRSFLKLAEDVGSPRTWTLVNREALE